MHCPNCYSEFNLRVHSLNNKVETHIELAVSQKNLVRKALYNYWKWVAEGKPEFKKDQYFYDSYHDYIEFLYYDGKDAIYKYNIQVFDSPEGDDWVSGYFRLTPTNKLSFEERGEHGKKYR